MRVLLDNEMVIEAVDIFGHKDDNGLYYVSFRYEGSDDYIEYYYTGISDEEAKKRSERIVREAFEKGYVDCSDEPWDL